LSGIGSCKEEIDNRTSVVSNDRYDSYGFLQFYDERQLCFLNYEYVISYFIVFLIKGMENPNFFNQFETDIQKRMIIGEWLRFYYYSLGNTQDDVCFAYKLVILISKNKKSKTLFI
jgi:hypothetical protein